MLKRLCGQALMVVAFWAMWMSAASMTAAQCGSNSDCSAVEFCMKADGDCEGTGTCEEPPPACPLNIDPVCGCDGLTYDNWCFANQAGTNVAFEGECPPTACQDTIECGLGEYCAKNSGECPSMGTCEETPLACPLNFDPVCGCDGVNYDNDCFANMAETSVAYAGTCLPVCQNDGNCGMLEYCDTAHNSCGLPGACRIQPDVCAPGFNPVCGCDEITYDNSCFAAQSGVSVIRLGACGSCPYENGTDCIFSGRLESGNSSRWSATVGD